MKRNNRAVILLVLVAVALAVGLLLQTHTLHNTQLDYANRTSTLNDYNQANYYITGELYAVKPDGTQVVEDANGKLWEITDLHITRHDKLLLEIRNSDTVTHVWTEVWTPTQ